MTNTPELQPEAGWAGAKRVRLLPPAPTERGLLFRGASRLSRLFGRDDVPDILAVININPRLFWSCRRPSGKKSSCAPPGTAAAAMSGASTWTSASAPA